MKISYAWLQTYFDRPLPSADALAELFTFHSFEIEGIEQLRDKLHRAMDTIIDAKVLPDRAHYCLSHNGMALETSVLTRQPMKAARVSKAPHASLESKPMIKIEAPAFCRRYMGRYADIGKKKLPNAPIIKLLEAIGQRFISPIVDVTNFVMFDIGQPLHAFDADKVKGAIVIRAAKKGEKIELLDSSEGPGKEVELLPSDHVIADDLGPIAIAGVKGGKRAGITSATERIVIESANFAPTAVRRTAARLDLRSESSKRYENEITPELASIGMDEVSALIKQACPDVKFGPIADQYQSKAVQTIIDFDPAYIESRLGIKIPPAEAKDIIGRLGIAVSSGDEGKWRLAIPFNRLDLTIPDDIIEEVGRIYGYGHVQGVLPPVLKESVPILPAFYLSEKIKDVMISQGFSEVSLYSLVSKGDVETAYPLAKDKAFVRNNLADGMMACVEKNALNADLLGLDAIKVFEIGHVFTKDGEKAMLSLGVSQWKKVNGQSAGDILQASIDALNKELNISVTVPKIILKGNNAVCELGLDEVMGLYQSPMNASYADLRFKRSSSNIYKKISPYPFIGRDIAVFVPESVQDGDVWQAIEKSISNVAAAGFLKRHSLFDTFKKDDKVSYAFHMVFQSMDRTMTDDEANKIMEMIYKEMKGKGWEVR